MLVVQLAQRPTMTSGATPYRRRRPERTLLYRAVQTHFETWLALRGGEFDNADPVPGHVEREFRRYLECGILAHGFARARCAECGHDFLIAFSCKGRGVCPACNAHPLTLLRLLFAIGFMSAFYMLYYLRSERSWDVVYGVFYSYFSFFTLF